MGGIIKKVSGSIGGIIGDVTGSNQAADASVAGAQAGIASKERMFERGIALQEPWREKGKANLGLLSGEMTGEKHYDYSKGFKTDPGYEFQKKESLDAINNAASNTGMQLSGDTLKSIGQYTTGMADKAYSDFYNRSYKQRQGYLNRISSLANVGQTVSSEQAQQVNQLGTSQMNAQMNQGDTRAAQSLAPFNTLMDIGSLAAEF